MRHLLSVLVLATAALGQTPNIAAVTNAAFPSVDLPPGSLTVPARSIVTIYGDHLADKVATASMPWPTTLGGTEVHLADDNCFDVSCDVVAGLIFVSPTQINFVVPATSVVVNQNDLYYFPFALYRIVLIRDGQRIDNRSYIIGGPGRLSVDSEEGDTDIAFEMGYDCLYSYSLTDPGSCGLSWNPGTHRAPLGAVTDAITGQLISSQNPVHQGQIVTIWFTDLTGGLTGLTVKNGLLQQSDFFQFNFGVAQLGKDVANTTNFDTQGAFSLYGVFQTPQALYVGESQIVGLDQINVAFPKCVNVSAATSEKRYDAFMQFSNPNPASHGGTSVRLYVPFVVKPGEPDCKFNGGVLVPLDSVTTLIAIPNPAQTGKTVSFTATITARLYGLSAYPTGTVTFFDGSTPIGSGKVTLMNQVSPQTVGVASFSTSALASGVHNITAQYNGDGGYGASTSGVLVETVK